MRYSGILKSPTFWVLLTLLIIGLVLLMLPNTDIIFRTSLVASLVSVFIACVALAGTRVDVIGTDRRADKVSWLFEFVRCRGGATFSFLTLGDLNVKDVRLSVAESAYQVHRFSVESLKAGVTYPGNNNEVGAVTKIFIPLRSDDVNLTIHVSWSTDVEKSSVGDFRMSDVYYVSVGRESWWRLGRSKYIAVKL